MTVHIWKIVDNWHGYVDNLKSLWITSSRNRGPIVYLAGGTSAAPLRMWNVGTILNKIFSPIFLTTKTCWFILHTFHTPTYTTNFYIQREYFIIL